MPRTAVAFLLTLSMSLTQSGAGTITSSYPRVEALLIKTNGRWQTLREHQLDRSTESAWNQLPH